MAAANTPLNAQMLERHLYDTMPSAWQALGKKTVPSPIPKASKIGARRHSIGMGPPQPAAPPMPTIVDVGRVLTRRVSRLMEMNQQNDGGQKTQKLITRRQSIQVDVLHSLRRTTLIDTLAFKSASTYAMKRKLNDSKQMDGSTGSTTTKSEDDSVFKKPAVPRKTRKLSTNAPAPPAPPAIDAAILANVAAINKIAACGTVVKKITSQSASAPIRPAAADVSPPKKPRTQAKAEAKSVAKTNAKSANATQSSQMHLPDISALFNAVIEKNASKVNEYVRGSLVGMLNEFWDVTKPTEQLEKLQQQMDSMRTIYTGQIDGLKQENDCLQLDLKTKANKCDAQSNQMQETMQENAKLSSDLCATKSKLSVLTSDLRKSIAK